MPNAFLSIDQSFPRFSGTEKPDEKIRIIQNYLYMLVEYLRYVLNNLSPDNFNDDALSKFIDEIRAGRVIAETVISNTVIVQNLYATFGDVVELTVDTVRTIRKLARYWAADTSVAYFQYMHEQVLERIVGTVATVDGVAQTEQLTNRFDEPLYYKAAPTADTWREAGIDTTPTAWPVTCYKYDEIIKEQSGFIYDSGLGLELPTRIAGAGDGATALSGKMIEQKRDDGYYWTYYKRGTGEKREIKLTDDAVFISPEGLKKLDFYDNGFRAEYYAGPVAMTWQKDVNGRITKFITEDNVEIPITWNAGNM
jgi:hypothetical protein